MVIKGIKKSYGRKVILSDISLSAKSGSCIGILGSNGSGKSTLLSVLSGVLKPDAGSFTYENTDLLKNSRARSSAVGYVPQGTPLIEELTAKDNLRLWYTTEEMNASLGGGVLKMLGVDEFLKVPVHKMSGGMKKRLSIGCAVAHFPKILLLDEPCAALDLACKENISEYLKKFKADGGIILLATHDVQELPLCDSLYILKNGVLESYEYDGDIHRLAGCLK